MECPRCFYLDRKIGISRPPSYPFTLNSAVDRLLKQEFDIFRVRGNKHPLIEKYGIDAVPVGHKNLEQWRHNFTGIQFYHQPTNLLIYGAIDDLWQNSKKEYIVVDYKATSKDGDITDLDQEWQDAYKRQMEIYQWLLRQNGLKVSPTGYFVYCNGRSDKKAFDAKLEFDISLIPYVGNDSWVEKIIFASHSCLEQKSLPKPSDGCDYCRYNRSVSRFSR